MIWQLQDAKNKLSEVVDKAVNDGPQEITKHGKKTAVVISIDDFQKLKKRKGSLVDFFQNSPLKQIDLKRKKDYSRKIDL